MGGADTEDKHLSQCRTEDLSRNPSSQSCWWWQWSGEFPDCLVPSHVPPWSQERNLLPRITWGRQWKSEAVTERTGKRCCGWGRCPPGDHCRSPGILPFGKAEIWLWVAELLWWNTPVDKKKSAVYIFVCNMHRLFRRQSKTLKPLKMSGRARSKLEHPCFFLRTQGLS